MDRLFGELWGRPFGMTATRVPLDVWQDEKAVYVRAPVAGYRPEEVEITVDDQGLFTLKGEHRAEEERKESDYLLRETSWGRFQRQVSLPVEVKAGEATAEFKDGVLLVTIPKARPATTSPVKIPVNTKK
jgi:HSP20 family protein